jgi:hypothetical protein
MKPLALIALLFYSGLALGGYLVSGVLQALVKNALSAFPKVIAGAWSVYPARNWPGVLKVVGYPLTLVFLVTVATAFVLFHIFVVVALSPMAVWRLCYGLVRSGRGGPQGPPPTEAAEMRAIG